jgi:hypothetical protein
VFNAVDNSLWHFYLAPHNPLVKFLALSLQNFLEFVSVEFLEEYFSIHRYHPSPLGFEVFAKLLQLFYSSFLLLFLLSCHVLGHSEILE